MALFAKRPKLTVEQEVAKNVGIGGVPGAMKFYQYMKDVKESGFWGEMFRGMGERGLDVLGQPPYAPAPTLQTQTFEETREAERKRISKRRRGRGQTVLTGSLEPTTRGKTLLG